MLSTSHSPSRRRQVGRSRTLALAALGAALALPASAQADNAYLKMPGADLRGESVHPIAPNTIELGWYSWGFGASGFDGFLLKKRVDRTSPALMLAAAQGRVISSARVIITRPDDAYKGSQTYLEYCLRNVTVKSVKVEQTPSDGRPAEIVGLDFDSFAQRYIQLGQYNQQLDILTSGWNDPLHSPIGFLATCGS